LTGHFSPWATDQAGSVREVSVKPGIGLLFDGKKPAVQGLNALLWFYSVVLKKIAKAKPPTPRWLLLSEF
jgi:hypothetical protein